MAIFNSAVLTRKGNELLIDAAAGNKITFTRMIVGCGEYTDAERERNKLEKMEGLKDAKQEFTFSAYKKVSEQCFLLTAVISNRELAKGYKITEIGIYGKISDDSEDFLCSIAVTNSIEESDTFPPYNGLQECQIVQDYYVTISPDAEVTVITKGASVLVEDFLATIEEIRKEFKDKIEALKRSFQAGVDKIYNYLKGLGFTPADKSPDAICVSIQNIYDRRYEIGYADGRTQGYEAGYADGRTQGYADGRTQGYEAGYADGRLQGQNDVIANPDSYGISTGAKAFGLVSGGAQNYTCTKSGTYHIKVEYDWYNNLEHNNVGNKVSVYVAGVEYKYIDYHHGDKDWIDDSVHISGDVLTLELNAGDVINITVSDGYEDCAGTYAAWIVY